MPSQTALVIEDDRFISMIEKRVLENLGLQVVLAGSLIDAFREAGQGNWSLIVLDLHLPDSEGAELLSYVRLHPHFRGAPILCVSGDEDAARLIAGLANVHLLAKPFQRDTLRQAVVRCLQPFAKVA
jgi:DNA-binding response OmpR family regulator